MKQSRRSDLEKPDKMAGRGHRAWNFSARSGFFEILNLVPEVFSILTVIAVFVPFKPAMPEIGLDDSWHFGINQAVAQGLVFGRDIVFAYGPYGSIFTKVYHPATDGLMLWGTLFLGICYSVLLLSLARAMNRRWILVAYAGFLASMMYSHDLARDRPQDALIFSYPLLLALLTYRATSPSAGKAPHFSRRFKIALGILFLPLGLLPLVKATSILICGSLAVCCIVLLVHARQRTLAGVCALLPVGFGILLWGLSGQPLGWLPGFFMSMRPIVSGYAQGVARVGNSNEIALYLVASGFILYAALRDQTASTIRKTALTISFALFLYIAFKEGFVRHDTHAVTAATSVVLAALAGAFVLGTRPAILTIMLLSAAVACGYIDHHYVPFSLEGVYTNTRDTYRDAWEGLRLRLAYPGALKGQFDDALASIAKQVPIRPLQGTVDLYSYHQSTLLASGNAWSPRPMFQSPSAYTPELERLNADHLRGATMPENVLFRVEPIDHRFPALEDGLSWPILLNNYSVIGMDNFFVYLKKKNAPPGDPSLTEFYNAERAMGDAVGLPSTREAVFAQIDVAPTLIGKLLTILYKPPELIISVLLNDGRIKTYRFVPGMATAGFVLSPLVEDMNGFVLMRTPNRDVSADNGVKSFAIAPVGGRSLAWKNTYSVKLSALDWGSDTALLKH